MPTIKYLAFALIKSGRGKRPEEAWQPTRIVAGKGANSGGIYGSAS